MEGYTNLSLIKGADDIRKGTFSSSKYGKSSFVTMVRQDPKSKKKEFMPGKMNKNKFKLPRLSMPLV